MTQFEAETLAGTASGDFSFRESFFDRFSGRRYVTTWTFARNLGYAVRTNKWNGMADVRRAAAEYGMAVADSDAVAIASQIEFEAAN